MDETSLTTVQKSADKIVSMKGKSQVGSIASADCGESVTCVSCISASGVYVPLMLIYTRVKLSERLQQGGPVGILYKYQNTDACMVKCFYVASKLH